MSSIAVICARGGSKGLPGKNIRLLGGLPLIAWTIMQAIESDLFDLIVVSSDSTEILEAAEIGGPILRVNRPSDLATDTVSVHPAILHSLTEAEAHLGVRGENFVYLQVTSPLRVPEDIKGAVELWRAHRPGSVVSAAPARSSPYFTIVEETDNGTVRLSKPTNPPLARRQNAPQCWDLNGAIYVFDRTRYADDPRVLYPDTRMFEMPEDRSVDIDTLLDFELAELQLKKRTSTA